MERARMTTREKVEKMEKEKRRESQNLVTYFQKPKMVAIEVNSVQGIQNAQA